MKPSTWPARLLGHCRTGELPGQNPRGNISASFATSSHCQSRHESLSQTEAGRAVVFALVLRVAVEADALEVAGRAELFRLDQQSLPTRKARTGWGFSRPLV